MRRRLRYIEQMQQTECGICCVAMIMNYYGCSVDINELRSENEVGREGSSIIQLKSMLIKYGMQVKVYETSPEGLFEIKTPAILFWENQHYVILKKITRSKAVIVDPEYGAITFSRQEFDRSYCGFVICCQPGQKNLQIHKQPSVWYEFRPIIRKNRWIYLGMFVCSTMTYLGSIGFPIIIQHLIDEQNQGAFKMKIPIVLLAAALYILFEFLKNIQLINLQANIDEDINNSMFCKLLRLPYKYFDMRNKSDILVSMSSGMVIRDVIVHQFINGIIECGAVIVVITYMFMANLLLASISTIVFLVLFFLMFFLQFVIKDRGMSLIVAQKKLQEVQTETIFSILNVKMLSLEQSIQTMWRDRFKRYKKNYKRREYLGNSLNLFTFSIINVVPLLILILGLMLTWQGKMTLGKSIAFYSLSGTFFSLSGSVCAMFISLVNSSLYMDRVADIMKSEEQKQETSSKCIKLKGNIILRDVCFKYSTYADYVIDHINLKIREGEKIAIVGKSGSGKSTLVKLLIGVYTQSSGEIQFEGIDVSELNLSNVRGQIGVVPQDITLFNRSIYENIIANRTDITMEEVIHFCKMVGIHDDIENMSMKYHTIISEMGGNLSGGQRQRIALARALVGKPKILILDEATSSLDTIYEKSISNQLDDIHVTRIVIAHRLSTIYDADRIIVMNAGRIVETGTHGELIKKNGFYRSLYHPESSLSYKDDLT